MNKERVLNSSQLDVDVDRLKQIARGQYFSLPVLQNKAFDSLTKSEDKKKQLVENSNVVRRSLDSLDIEPEKKKFCMPSALGLNQYLKYHNFHNNLNIQFSS